MVDIVALLRCARPHVTATTLRQFSRIIVAMLVMTGRVTMLGLSRWAGQGGSYRTVQRFFSTGAPVGHAVLGVLSSACLPVQRRSTCWWAMKSWPPKRGNTPMAWIGSLPVCMASRCQGWPSSRCRLVSIQARRSFPIRVEQVVRSDAEKAASKAKADAKKPKAAVRTASAWASKGQQEHTQSRRDLHAGVIAYYRHGSTPCCT